MTAMETASADHFIFGSVSMRRRQQEEIRRNFPPSDAKRRSVDHRSPSEMGLELNDASGEDNAGQGNGVCLNGVDGNEEDESRSGDSGVESKGREDEACGGDCTKEGDEAGASCGCGVSREAGHGRGGCIILNGRGDTGGVPWNSCPLCRRPYEDPRVLACLHAFCSPCLRRLLLPQLSAVPCEDEEGVEELEMEEEEGEEEDRDDGTRNHCPVEPVVAEVTPDMDDTHSIRGRNRGPNSESGKSENAQQVSSSASTRGPSLRSWASFKGAWSPRSRRRVDSRSNVAAADDASTAGSEVAVGTSIKSRDASPRKFHRSLTLTKAATPPSSPPMQRRHGSMRVGAGGPLPFHAAFPWRKRSSSIASSAAAEGVILLLRCPTCGTETEVPTPPGVRRGSCTPSMASSAISAAVSTLPLHAVLQHRMYLASINRKGPTVRPKCDLCTADATSKCADCVLTLCALCGETHRRQRSTSSHALLLLNLEPSVSSRISRVPMCPLHPTNAQRLFCGPCGRLACRACHCASASNHRCEPVAHAARNWAAPAVRTALEKARPYAANACASVEGLRHMEQRVQMRTAQVEEEVDCFVDSWIRSLEEHRRVLHAEARRARDSKLDALRSRRTGLERRAESLSVAVKFADELLAEATDAELLGLAGALVKRLDWCRASAEAAAGSGSSRSPFPASPGDQASTVSLQFLPAERAGTINGHEMYGVVTAQTVCPARCRIFAEGLANCRQHRKTEVVVVTKDSEDQPIGHGGEQVAAELRYRDASHRQLPVHISDQKDGSYILTFIPDAAGVLSLAVTVQGKNIQGSPYTVHARTIRAHTGIFHCCTFCSSHGNKEATCACGGKMPGGYKGCGHGHTGHPGRRHWSCCGNVLEGSECGRANGVFTYTI